MFPVDLYITKYTQDTASLFFREVCPVDCKLHKLFGICRLHIQGLKQADTRRGLSWSGQLICLQAAPTRSSGREEPVVGMTHRGRLQGCRLSSPAPGRRAMLDTFTIGFETPWKNVSWRCWQTGQKPLNRGGDLWHSKAACLGSWLLQWVLVPPKWVLLCY